MYVMTRQKREHGRGEFDDKGMEGTREAYKGVEHFGGLHISFPAASCVVIFSWEDLGVEHMHELPEHLCVS